MDNLHLNSFICNLRSKREKENLNIFKPDPRHVYTFSSLFICFFLNLASTSLPSCGYRRSKLGTTTGTTTSVTAAMSGHRLVKSLEATVLNAGYHGNTPGGYCMALRRFANLDVFRIFPCSEVGANFANCAWLVKQLHSEEQGARSIPSLAVLRSTIDTPGMEPEVMPCAVTMQLLCRIS